MKKLTRQSIFNRVVRGLAGQMWERSLDPSADEESTCAYRGKHGHKCALGHLLTDAEVKEIGNTKAVLRETELPARLRFHFPLLRELQQIHDDGQRHRDLRDSYMCYAVMHHLKWPKDIL